MKRDPNWPRRIIAGSIPPKLHLPLDEFGPPEMIEIEPIHTCNLRCVMCHVSYEKLTNARLDVDKVLNHLDGLEDRFVAVGATHEPAAHPQFAKLLRGLSDRRMKIQLTTNGTLMNERIVNEIAGCNLDHVTISFDGIRKETYERIRRNADYDLAIKRITHLRETFRKDPTFFFVNYTVLRSNLDEALEAVEFWDSLGFDLLGFILMVVRDRNEYIMGESLMDSMDLVYQKLDAVAEAVLERGLRMAVTSPAYQRSFALKEKFPGNFFSNMVMSDNPAARMGIYPRVHIQNGPYPGMPVDCRSPFKYARIIYNGDVKVCDKFTIGNIHDRPFMEIWNGPEAIRVREMLQTSPRVCHACDYYRFCIRAHAIDYEEQDNFFAQHVKSGLPRSFRKDGQLPHLAESDYHGFNLIDFNGEIYALDQSVGPLDLMQATEAKIRDLLVSGQCLIGDTAEAVKRRIDALGGRVGGSRSKIRHNWPGSFEEDFKSMAESFSGDTDEDRRLRELYEDLATPPQIAGATSITSSSTPQP